MDRPICERIAVQRQSRQRTFLETYRESCDDSNSRAHYAIHVATLQTRKDVAPLSMLPADGLSC